MTSRLVMTCAAFAALMTAQSTQTMRANIRGGGTGDAGKCTIEVDVDGVADVEIRGETAYIRTLQGQPSMFRRFECTSVLPRNPVDFRFRGVDGRGNVQLVREPNQGGVAVVRIEDKQGGREGYTFDVEWRGGGYANDPYYDNNRRNVPYDNRRQNDPYYDNRRQNDPYYDNRSRNRNDSIYNNGRFSSATVSACETAVAARARQNYGVRDPRFTSADVDDMRGNRDRVMGTFQGNRGEQYEYSCTVNENNGRIRSVDVRRR
jgi:hypothetical protein